VNNYKSATREDTKETCFKMASSGDNNCDFFLQISSYLEQIQNNPQKGVSVICLLSSCACLVICLLFNIYIAVNIIYKKKYQISYFKIFLLLLTVQIFYLCLSIFSQVLDLFPDNCLISTDNDENEGVKIITSITSPLTRSALGVFGCVAGALTIERFLSSTTAGACLRGFLNTFIVLMCLIIPLSLAICFILVKFEIFQSIIDLDQELSFGLEICVYVIFPLLLLTVFGTVNCCKVTMSSRMLPTPQIQAVKINIAVTVATNIALFIFLVQESLKLWEAQLRERNEDADFKHEVDRMLKLGTMGESIATLLLNMMISLVSILYCCISSDCCHDCCCSSINELEQIRYEQVHGKEVL